MPQTIQGCIYPTNAEFRTLQMDLIPTFEEGRVGLEILPFQTSDYAQIIFNQPDIFRGLQQYRGLDQPTQNVTGRYNPYGKLCAVEPGYYGEHDVVTEEFMTRAAQPGTCSDVIDITEYLARLQQRLMQRRYDRVEALIWQALAFGRYEALNAQGQIVHQAIYNIPQINVAIPWTNFALSTPLGDFRQVRLRQRGTSARFGLDARAIMNQTTANNLFRNQNPNDVGKAGLSACCTFMGMDIVNQQFAAQMLPQIEIYDGGYVDDAGNYQLFIPDGYVIIVGKRPGNVPIGHFWLTRNTVGCDVSSGFWQKLVDSCDREVPRRIALYDGFNGGPAVEYPKAIVVLRVGS